MSKAIFQALLVYGAAIVIGFLTTWWIGIISMFVLFWIVAIDVHF